MGLVRRASAATREERPTSAQVAAELRALLGSVADSAATPPAAEGGAAAHEAVRPLELATRWEGEAATLGEGEAFPVAVGSGPQAYPASRINERMLRWSTINGLPHFPGCAQLAALPVDQRDKQHVGLGRVLLANGLWKQGGGGDTAEDAIVVVGKATHDAKARGEGAALSCGA